MLHNNPRKRLTGLGVLLALSMILSGCFVTPGKFDATLMLNNDERFAFEYNGEIFFLGLSRIAMMGGVVEDEFVPSKCLDEQTYEERECTPDELAEQRAQWDAGAQSRRREREEKAKQVAAILGGIDPTDPDAGNELARKLERQRGWESVQYAGDGIFNVRYAITGRLTHDLMFPVMEGIPVPSPFVQVVLRKEGKVRVNAPGFAMEENKNPVAGLMMSGFASGMASAMTEKNGDAPPAENGGMPGVPALDGTFRIMTNGHILANNTDEGPTRGASSQTLTWGVSTRTHAAPTALIELSRQ